MPTFDAPPPGATVTVAGARIHYHDIGEGEPLLMLQSFGPLPGTSAWFTFHKVTDAFADRYRCILVDYPNFGFSDPVEFHEPVHALYVRCVLGVMDALGVERARVLGTSTGGTVAIDLALAAPERVSQLVIGGCEASTGGDPCILTPTPTEAGRLFGECQSSPPARDRIERFARSLVHDPSTISERLVDHFYEWRMREPQHAEHWHRSVSVPHSNVASLSAITVPTLVIHGRSDRMVALEQALRIVSLVPTADLVVLNRCGHWPAFERPASFARLALAAFAHAPTTRSNPDTSNSI